MISYLEIESSHFRNKKPSWSCWYTSPFSSAHAYSKALRRPLARSVYLYAPPSVLGIWVGQNEKKNFIYVKQFSAKSLWYHLKAVTILYRPLVMKQLKKMKIVHDIRISFWKSNAPQANTRRPCCPPLIYCWTQLELTNHWAGSAKTLY